MQHILIDTLNGYIFKEICYFCFPNREIMQKAIVIGSTGLVGTQLIKQLLENPDYSEVISLVRRESDVTHVKLSEHVVVFDAPDSWKLLVKGDVLFSAMGTTIKQAKSKENQYKIDFTYQYETAKIAAENGVPTYVLVSSTGANPNSLFFYSNMKGKLEEEVKKLPFKTIHVLQPGQLDGDRTENRILEKWGLKVMYKLNDRGFLKKLRPIQGQEVATAMIAVSNKPDSGIYRLDELFELIEN